MLWHGSFAYYIENFINAIKAKGATAIISSVTPDNIWTGNEIGTGGRFVDYAQSIGRNESITYVNHNAYVAQAFNKLGQSTVRLNISLLKRPPYLTNSGQHFLP